MTRGKAQGRKGKQKNKPGAAGIKTNANDKPVVAKKGTQVKTPKGGPPQKTQTPDRNKMSRSEKQKMNKAKLQAKNGPKPQKEKPKSKEDLDKEMDDYMMKDEKVASKKLDEDMDTYWEQKKAKEAEEAGEADPTEDAAP